MADNTTLNLGSGGDVIATDDIGGVKHQYVKLEYGDPDTATKVANVAGQRLPVDLGADSQKTLQASATSGTTNATTTKTTTTGLDNYESIQVLISITAGGAATGVLRLYLQDSCDGGVTWEDLIASNPFTFGGGAVNQMFHVQGALATSKAQGSATAIETLADGTARQGPFGNQIRVREKVSGVSGSPTGVTYNIQAVFKR